MMPVTVLDHTRDESFPHKYTMLAHRIPAAVMVALMCLSCADDRAHNEHEAAGSYADTAFWQEYHEAWKVSNDPQANDVRSVAVDGESNVWAAATSGVFMKRAGESEWISIFNDEETGPSFSLITAADGSIWMSTWKGVFRFKDGVLENLPGVDAPASVLCLAKEGVYALGPNGVWLFRKSRWEKKSAAIARSVRAVISDQAGGLWIGTDVGLYHLTAENDVEHYYTTEHLPSAYVRGVSFDQHGSLWAGGLGGVSILNDTQRKKQLTSTDGIPAVGINTIERAPDGVMWVGTDKGIVRFDQGYNASLRFSRRWLLDDRVNDIAFDNNGNAWIATAAGVSAIKRKRMTLEKKALYFYDVLMRRHIRDPWVAGQCKLPVPGDTTQWLPDDDDNDGEYTGNYLAMESFRYAATKDPRAKENAAKAFGFLRFLQEVTGTAGFFARTVVPADWKEIDDANRTYTKKELAFELVKEPRFKPVEVRWHLSGDGKWKWKGDTSSDEMCGHMMGYYFYYELVAGDEEKAYVRQHIVRIVDALIKNDYTLVDVDGAHTRWGVWSPSLLNKDPEWMPDRSLNSMELLSFIKLASYTTGDPKYEEVYRNLIRRESYLENMQNIPDQNPGWFIYFDVMLAAYQYPILLRCEKDPEILAFYQRHIDRWFERYKRDNNPLINFIYCYSRNKRLELTSSVEFLKDTPLDLIDWPIDHTQREDVKIVRYPVLDDLQIDRLPPASIRGTIRWDKNPYAAISGNPSVEREPVFWLLPYWMGRYLGMIEPH